MTNHSQIFTLSVSSQSRDSVIGIVAILLSIVQIDVLQVVIAIHCEAEQVLWILVICGLYVHHHAYRYRLLHWLQSNIGASGCDLVAVDLSSEIDIKSVIVDVEARCLPVASLRI